MNGWLVVTGTMEFWIDAIPKPGFFNQILQGKHISSPGPAKSGSPSNELCPIRLYHIIVSSTLIGNQFKIACIRAGHKLFQNETFITMNATHSSQLMSQIVRSLSSVNVQKKSNPGSFRDSKRIPSHPARAAGPSGGTASRLATFAADFQGAEHHWFASGAE